MTINEPKPINLSQINDKQYDMTRGTELQSCDIPVMVYDEGTDKFHPVLRVENHMGTIRLVIDSTLELYYVELEVRTVTYQPVSVWASRESEAKFEALQYLMSNTVGDVKIQVSEVTKVEEEG